MTAEYEPQPEPTFELVDAVERVFLGLWTVDLLDDALDRADDPDLTIWALESLLGPIAEEDQ